MALVAPHLPVVFTKCGRDVDEPRAGVEGHEPLRSAAARLVAGHDAVVTRVIELVGIGVKRRRVAFADELGALDRFLDGESTADLFAEAFDQRLGDHEQFITLGVARVRVAELGMNAREHVGRKGPGRGGPDDQRCVFVLQRKANVRRRVVDGLVAAADFAGRQSRAALRPPPNNLVALVQKPLVEQFG